MFYLAVQRSRGGFGRDKRKKSIQVIGPNPSARNNGEIRPDATGQEHKTTANKAG